MIQFYCFRNLYALRQSALVLLISLCTTARLFAQVCTEPAADALCTPPTTWDKNVVASGTVTWASLNIGNSDDVTTKIRISGTGTVKVPSGDLLLKSANAVLFIDGPTLVLENGNLQLTTSGSRYLQNGGKLQTYGNFQQISNTVVCIVGTAIEIGEEIAGTNFTPQTNTAANWQNDGGYRYLKNDCINVTQDFQLQSSGSGTGINGLDVISGCCIEIGDRGANHATPTAFGTNDGDDSGNWQNSNRQYIFNTDIVIANGSFQTSNNKITACTMHVKVNKSGSFQVNSGTLEGDGVCIAVEDIFENSGTWTATGISWYSDKNNSTNVPNAGTEKAKATILADCFGACSCTAAVATCTIASITATPSACSNNQYNLTGAITFLNTPTTGTLTVTITGGGTQTLNAPFTSPLNYSIAAQTADGASHTVTAAFSASAACTKNQTYNAPATCNGGGGTAPKIGIAKMTKSLVSNGDGTFNATFLMLVENVGTVPAYDIAVLDPLSIEFGSYQNSTVSAAGQYTIVSKSIVHNSAGATVTTINNSYNGSSNTNLISPTAGQSLAVGSHFTVELVVKFNPTANKTNFTNQATVQADATENGTANAEVTDLSDATGSPCGMGGNNLTAGGAGNCASCFTAATGTGGKDFGMTVDSDCNGIPNETGNNDPCTFTVQPVVAATCTLNAGTIKFN